MRVAATVGMPGSGKSEAATVASEAGIPVITMGDVIRHTCRERGREVTESNMGEVATALREEEGPAAIAKRSIPLIEDALTDTDVVLVDGIRSDAEVDRFEKEYGEAFLLVAIQAPFELRLERIRDRGRDPGAEARADLKRRDERELGYGMGEAIDRADTTIENTGSLSSFHAAVREVLDLETPTTDGTST